MKDTDPMNADVRRLDVLAAGWDPFSREEALWHGCPGHEWVRFDFDLSRGRGEARLERVTRCERCGAPRCDVVRQLGAVELQRLVAIIRRARARGFERRDEASAVLETAGQFRRCTLERHHDGKHDFLELP